MADSFSKPIQKTDDSAKELIIEALEGQATGGFDLDSVYRVKDTYYVLEFLKCDTVRPFNSHPRRYWFKNSQKFLSLWDITTKLGGRLYLVNYEDSREHFKVIRVLSMDQTGIKEEQVKLWNFDQFKKWFKALNNLSSERETVIEKVETTEEQVIRPLILDSVPRSEQYITYLPLYSIRAACGYFGEGEEVSEMGWMQVEGMGKLNRNMFIVQASGNSMEPRIHDGDYCVFEKYSGGSRQGKIVLAQHRGYFDEDNAGAYSIKQYSSEKSYNDDGSWQHESITLRPFNHEYEPIRIDAEDAESFAIIGALVGVVDAK